MLMLEQSHGRIELNWIGPNDFHLWIICMHLLQTLTVQNYGLGVFQFDSAWIDRFKDNRHLLDDHNQIRFETILFSENFPR